MVSRLVILSVLAFQKANSQKMAAVEVAQPLKSVCDLTPKAVKICQDVREKPGGATAANEGRLIKQGLRCNKAVLTMKE